MVSMMVKRTVAYILDFLVVSAFMWPISYLLYLFVNPVMRYQIFNYFIVVAPILIIIYFTFFEKLRGTTVGKMLMFIEVEDEKGGPITYRQAIIRSVSKLWWFPIVFDYLIGLLYGTKDERLLGQLSHTKVVEEDKSKFNS